MFIFDARKRPEGVAVGGVGGLERLLVCAGAGEYPLRLVEGARRAGVPCVEVMAVRGSTDRATCRAAHAAHWVTLGSVSEGLRAAGARGYDGVLLAGQINPLSLFRGRFDPEITAWLRALPVKNAHSIFRKFIEQIESCGLRVLPASLFLDDNLPGVGPLTQRGLTDDERADVAHGMRVAHDVGVHDVGQTVMVKRGMVLSVEAFEGTNQAIRRGGRLGGAGGVVFKAAREGHDMRFDIPVAGLKTLKVMRRAGATALAFQAGRLVLLDRAAVVDYANRHGIAVVGIDSGLPPAPLRP